MEKHIVKITYASMAKQSSLYHPPLSCGLPECHHVLPIHWELSVQLSQQTCGHGPIACLGETIHGCAVGNDLRSPDTAEHHRGKSSILTFASLEINKKASCDQQRSSESQIFLPKQFSQPSLVPWLPCNTKWRWAPNAGPCLRAVSYERQDGVNMKHHVATWSNL